jgi:hypothetical protein
VLNVGSKGGGAADRAMKKAKNVAEIVDTGGSEGEKQDGLKVE